MNRIFIFSVFFLFIVRNLCAQPNFWELTNGPGNNQVNSLASDPTTGFILAGTGDGVFGTGTNGNNWVPMGLTNLYVLSIAVNSSGHIFAGASSTGLYDAYRSTDFGSNWTMLSLTANGIWEFDINSQGHIFAATGAGIFRSTDNGDNWTEVGLADTCVTSFAINSNGDIFASTCGDGIFHSNDNGDHWMQVGLVDTNVKTIDVSPNGYVYAGSWMQTGIYRSIDNGNTWTQTGLQSTPINTLVINSIEHIFAGTIDGVYRSTDNGDSWVQINSGLTSLDVGSFAIKPDGIIFAGIWGSGVFRSTETTPIENDRDNSVITFSLDQNYPNPFNPATTIEFSLPTAAEVSLVIYNVAGQEVERLIERRTMAPGQYSVEWAPRALPSGVYFYRLTAGSFTQSRKMVLMK
ncbi:MAG: T9SS type A sorting domain-containing protein [Calditrichaceae bacterium]|nr:T9SS type A sorting domain-containing protein [Calditrichia bacterium]NUQ42307.1 T9SS type A sorting domain-containing protein [Calditrichaceae bacterium]